MRFSDCLNTIVFTRCQNLNIVVGDRNSPAQGTLYAITDATETRPAWHWMLYVYIDRWRRPQYVTNDCPCRVWEGKLVLPEPPCRHMLWSPISTTLPTYFITSRHFWKGAYTTSGNVSQSVSLHLWLHRGLLMTPKHGRYTYNDNYILGYSLGV